MKPFHFAVVLFAAVACLNLHAQTTYAYASIPFDFRMGDVLMPAGDYDFNQSGAWLTAHEAGGRANCILLTAPASRPAGPTKPELVFNRYGDRYFFAKIWTEYSSEGRAVRRTSTEKELAGRVDHFHEAVIALKQK